MLGSPFFGYFLWRDKESDLPPATPANDQQSSKILNYTNPPPQQTQGDSAGVSAMKYGLQLQAILLVRETYCFVLSRSISAYAE